MVWRGVLCLLLYGVARCFMSAIIWCGAVFYVYYYMVWRGVLCLLLYGVARCFMSTIIWCGVFYVCYYNYGVARCFMSTIIWCGGVLCLLLYGVGVFYVYYYMVWRDRGKQRITFLDSLCNSATGGQSKGLNFLKLSDDRDVWRGMVANVCSRSGT